MYQRDTRKIKSLNYTNGSISNKILNLINRINLFNDYIIITLMIFLSDSMMFSLNKNISYDIFRKILVTFILIVIYIDVRFIKKERIVKKHLFCAVLVILHFLLSFLVTGANILSYAYFYILLATSYFISRKVPIDKFKEIFVNIIIFLSVFSLIGYFFPDTFSKLSKLVIVTSTRNDFFHSIIFTNIPYSRTLQMRNWGIFWEPGVFQIYLYIALLFEIYKKRMNMHIVVLFIITLFTTKSAAAIINLIIFMLIVITHDSLSKKNRIIFVFIFIFMYLFISTNVQAFEKVFSKIEEFQNESRFLTLIFGVKVIRSNLFFGIGPGNLRNEILELGNLSKVSVTNTWISLFSSYGFFIGLIFIFLYYRIVSKSRLDFNQKVLLFIFVIIIFSSQNLSHSFLFLYFPMSSLRRQKYYE